MWSAAVAYGAGRNWEVMRAALHGTLQLFARLEAMTEQVLVLPRDRVPGGCDFTGVRQATDADLVELQVAIAEHGRYVDRPAAEDDQQLKQLIPYVVVRDGDRVFLMERTTGGGDARLHGKASIGVGGHLNPVDAGEDPLLTGLGREWAEELDAGWQPFFELRGLLNDDSNAVGAVHLGVVFEEQAAGRPVAIREHEKLIGAFAGPAEVMAKWEQLETWSRLVADALGFRTMADRR